MSGEPVKLEVDCTPLPPTFASHHSHAASSFHLAEVDDIELEEDQDDGSTTGEDCEFEDDEQQQQQQASRESSPPTATSTATTVSTTTSNATTSSNHMQQQQLQQPPPPRLPIATSDTTTEGIVVQSNNNSAGQMQLESSQSSSCKVNETIISSQPNASATIATSDNLDDRCIVDQNDIDEESSGDDGEDVDESESESDEDDDDDDDEDDDETEEDEEEDDDEDDDDEDVDADSDDILDPGQHYFHLNHHHQESLISNHYQYHQNHHQQHHHQLIHNHILHNQLHLAAATGEELCENNNITDHTIISHCGSETNQQQPLLSATTPNLIGTHNDQNHDESGDVLNSERIVEVTRKLVRSTERDPDRDLRKQVLLKTAIKKLPHFMDYTNRYNDPLDQSFHCQSMSQQASYYEQDSQPKFYQSVQPNAIQMSTTGLRMLDLNDHDPEINNLDTTNKQQECQLQLQESDAQLQQQSLDLNQSYDPTTTTATSTTTTTMTVTSPEQPDYIGQVPNQQLPNSQYDRYNQMQTHHNHQHHQNHLGAHETYNNQYETNTTTTTTTSTNNSHSTTSMINRHSTLENLYQPAMNGSDINENIKDERIPIAFQIACDICDFTCAPDDNETKKSYDNLSNHYYSRSTGKEFTCATEEESNELSELGINGVDNGNHLMSICGDVVIGSRDHDNNSDSSSSSNSSTSSTDDSVNSIASQSIESSDEVNGTSFLETTLDSAGHFYHSSHDSGVSLFSPKSNKRSSSSIGLDDDMEVDHLTDLSDPRSPIIGTNNQYKKLRKREIID